MRVAQCVAGTRHSAVCSHLPTDSLRERAESILVVRLFDQALVEGGEGCFTFGRGARGVLGHGNEDDSLLPRAVEAVKTGADLPHAS